MLQINIVNLIECDDKRNNDDEKTSKNDFHENKTNAKVFSNRFFGRDAQKKISKSIIIAKKKGKKTKDEIIKQLKKILLRFLNEFYKNS